LRIQARFLHDQLVITGRTSQYVRIGDAGSHAGFRFCLDCTFSHYWDYSEAENLVVVSVGAFADSELPTSTFSVYAVRRHPWVSLTLSIVDN
jgi:hypothetical protein